MAAPASVDLSNQTVYFITGSNRGIGRGFITSLLSRPNTTVIASVRDPSSTSSTSLSTLPRASNSHLITLKIDSTSPTDALTAIETLRQQHGITRLDVVISNAGVSAQAAPLLQAPPEDLSVTMETNVGGALRLFQAVQPLLDRSRGAGDGRRPPVLVAISAGLGSIGLIDKIPPSLAWGLYGASKAALNFMARKIAYEERELVVLVVHPGHVDTAMGELGAKQLGIERAETSVEESVTGMMQIIDGATKETSGRFWSFDGTEIPW